MVEMGRSGLAYSQISSPAQAYGPPARVRVVMETRRMTLRMDIMVAVRALIVWVRDG